MHAVSQQDKTLNSFPKLPQMLTDFQNSFAGRLTGKFANKLVFKHPTTFYTCRYTTLWNVLENWRQFEICIVISDKTQDSTAKHLSCDWLLHYKFIIKFASKKL